MVVKVTRPRIVWFVFFGVGALYFLFVSVTQWQRIAAGDVATWRKERALEAFGMFLIMTGGFLDRSPGVWFSQAAKDKTSGLLGVDWRRLHHGTICDFPFRSRDLKRS